jgi:hypothetical protein
MEGKFSLSEFESDDKFNEYLESLDELPEDDNEIIRLNIQQLWLKSENKSENGQSTTTLNTKRPKLKLADNNHDLFYLSKSKINKNKLDKERQNNRLLFRCRKQAESTLPKTNKKSIDKLLKEPIKTPIMTQKELEIESSLFTPYLNDEKAVKDLFDNVKKIKETKKLEDERRRNFFLDSIVKSRLQAELNALIREEEIKKKIEAKMLDSKQIKLSNAEMRKRHWLEFITTLISSFKIRDTVFETRRLKEQDKKRWVSVILIQKIYRKYIKNKKNPKIDDKRLTLYEQIKISMDKDGSKEMLYKSRVKSANVILFLLKQFNKTFKSIVRAYFLKVRWVELKIKHHFRHTECRKIAMKNLMDRFLRALTGHVFVVLIGKGLDFKYSSELERKLNQKLIEKYCISNDKLSIITSMRTKDFHKYLRLKLNGLELTGYQFHQGVRFILDPIMLDRALEDYIFKSRKENIIKCDRERQIKIDIPVITTDNVREFILGGSDPLKSYLVDFNKQTCDHFEQLKCSGVVVAKHLDEDAPKILRLFHKNAYFLFYSKITSFELIDIVIDILDRMNRKEKTLHSSKKFLRMFNLSSAFKHEEKQILPKITIDEADIKNRKNEHINVNFPIGEQLHLESDHADDNTKDNNNIRLTTPPRNLPGSKKMFRKVNIKQAVETFN